MKNLRKKLILFLLRKHLGLDKYEPFIFSNQKSNALYCFDDDGIYKFWHDEYELSHVSLNWLLDDECIIIPQPKGPRIHIRKQED